MLTRQTRVRGMQEWGYWFGAASLASIYLPRGICLASPARAMRLVGFGQLEKNIARSLCCFTVMMHAGGLLGLTQVRDDFRLWAG